MKLLICTQIVDRKDPALGFFHRWIEAFSKKCDFVTVVCLKAGEYDFPKNVKVLSLGKEKGFSKIKILFNFYKYITSERSNYDSVFVHMNQIYIILGSVLWNIFNKTVSLWYAHGAVTKSLKLAEKMTDLIFTSTPEGFKLKSNKVRIVGQGIDCNYFKPILQNKLNDEITIITVGRISRVKQIHLLIPLLKENTNYRFHIIGSPIKDDDKKYQEECVNLSNKYSVSDRIKWVGPVENSSLMDYYSRSDIFVNFSETKSLDKVILEAIAAGLPVVTSNEAATKTGLVVSVEANRESIKNGIIEAIKIGKHSHVDEKFILNYSIDSLVDKIILNITKKKNEQNLQK